MMTGAALVKEPLQSDRRDRDRVPRPVIGQHAGDVELENVAGLDTSVIFTRARFGLVLSSHVAMMVASACPSALVSEIYHCVADVSVALLNFKLPDAGSAAVIAVR